MIPKSSATALLGGVNQKVLSGLSNIGKGRRVDFCDYGNLNLASQSARGLDYDVLLYPSAAAASSALATATKDAEEKQKAHHPVSFAVSGASGLNDGAWTEPGDGTLPPTHLAVIGTTVGPYLLVTLALTTDSTAHAERISGTAIKALIAKAG